MGGRSDNRCHEDQKNLDFGFYRRLRQPQLLHVWSMVPGTYIEVRGGTTARGNVGDFVSEARISQFLEGLRRDSADRVSRDYGTTTINTIFFDKDAPFNYYASQPRSRRSHKTVIPLLFVFEIHSFPRPPISHQ
eukprot:scaffold287_cov173-Amphora_coffeaeformis.AAC.4